MGSEARIAALVALLAGCGSGDDAPVVADPGRVTLHRLNRAEYDNTVRDLFATTQRPADRFPADDFGYGFSNVAQVLSLTATHLDLYQQAAEGLVEEISLDRTVPATTSRVEAEAGAGPGVVVGATRNVWTSGVVALTLPVTAAGDYDVTLLAAGENGARASVSIDGVAIGTWDPTAEEPTARVTLAAGDHEVAIALANPADEGSGAGRPTLALDAVTAAGPLGATLPPGPGRALIFTCDPTEAGEAGAIGEGECVEQIVRGFGRRAWRRPLHQDEVDRLLGLYADARAAGSSWEQGVEATLQAILVAPQFLYRMELDPHPDARKARALDDWELASRLSYFLWSSTPDDRLLDLADAGALGDPEALRGEVTRMLHDPKATSLVDTLGVEWLYLGAIDESAPDATAFPEFDEGLRASMRTEMTLFASDILLGDRSMLELVTGTRTRIDPRLAAHYGVTPPSDAGFAETDIPARAGIMGRAGWLTAVSYPTRTSPVRRGKWVLDNLTCESPAPPPPGVVGTLPADGGDTGITESIRDQFEQHREDPACASCHIPMDGIGFGLEHFDGVGRWRDVDEYGNPIDSTGTLVSGVAFDGSGELAAALGSDPKIPRCMVQKVFTFALGRSPRVEDLAALDDIGDQFAAGGYRFSALAEAIVLSDAFRYRTPAVTP